MNGLFGSAILDTAVGLVFVYLLLAIFCTTINEWIAGIFSTRARFLKKGLLQLLQDPNGAKDLISRFYKHPVIASMMDGQKHPSYIAARSFARVIMDLVTPNTLGPLDFPALENGINNLPDGRIRTALLALIQDADRNLNRAQRNIEAWYDDAMDRVSGWYKRHIQLVTVGVALTITMLANADTIHIARRLWTDPGTRTAIAEQAAQRAKMSGASDAGASGNDIAEQESKVIGDIFGWRNQMQGYSDWLERVLGWILTIVAVSLGAPFWFDALNKIINIRNAGKSPDERAKAPEKAKLPPADRAA
jgi:hypothetical protein